MPAATTFGWTWTGDPALIWVLGAGWLYWLGGRGARPFSAQRRRTALFVAGLAAIVVALDSPLDDLASKLQWAHMVQHVLLLLVAPPLLALARPWNRMWHGLPLGLRRGAAREVRQGRWSRPILGTARVLGDPWPSWLLFTCTLIFWHIPFAYDETLRSPPVHALEHALFFGVGLLFWTRVIDSPPWRSPLADGARAVYVGSAMVISWMLAIVLAVAPKALYSPYVAEATRPGGITAHADQQLAAGVMWVPGSIPFAIAILVIAYRWLEPEGPSRSPGTNPIAGSP
jgi:cytochrome c oxidase assembly factor CtaG